MKALGPAGKIVALCLPPVLMALAGLALQQRRRGGAAVASRGRSGATGVVQPKPPKADWRG